MKRVHYTKAALLITSMIMYAMMNAQSLPELQFTHITTKDGLSGPYVRSLFQDSRGLIWISTTNGLNRYDGKYFKIYRHNPADKNSLPSDDIWQIAEDAKGNFWVGTENGLCYFEPNENKYTNYFFEPGNKNSLAYKRAENVLIDGDGFVWIGALNGLQKFDPLNKQFSTMQFATSEELARNINSQAVYQLYLDRNKQLWVNAAGKLFLINRKTFTFQKMIDRFSGNLGVNNIFQDKNGQYWICYWGKGFAKFDGIHEPAENDFVTNTGIYFHFSEWEDLHHNNWLVITRDEGLEFYNPKTGELKQLLNDITKPGSFSSHGSGAVITDRDNNVWIGATNNLELLETGNQFFQYHWLGEKKDREDYYNFGLPSPVVKYNGFFWAGLWHGKGLIKMDSNFTIIKRYSHVPENSNNDNDKTIYSIYKDEQDIFWISTDHCIARFDEKKNSFQSFVPVDISPDAFEFRNIKRYDKNRLLVRTRYNGIYIFNRTTNQFEKHLCVLNTNRFPSDIVTDFTYDKKGMLWIATKGGVCTIDTNNLQVNTVFSEGAASLPVNDCWSLATDSLNNMWLSTSAGLCRINKENKTVTTYTSANGLPSNSLAKILFDNKNNLWINTSNGISCFRTADNSFRNFYKEDGLPQNKLDGTINKDENGVLYFGDVGLVLTIDPGNIPVNRKQPGVIITDINLDGAHHPVKLNSNKEKTIETTAGNNSLQVYFAVLNFNSPQRNRYYYTLEGVDKTWHESDRGIASYINIPPGNYILRVKGSNNSGVMNEHGDSMIVIVHPLWYQTWWFKLSAALLTFFLITYFVKRRIHNIRRESYLKQQVAETQMQALRAQMNPHFIFNSLNSIENFIMQNEKRLASDYLNKFARLIRMILDSSRNEVVPFAKDMEALQLYIDLEQLRFNNKFSCVINIDPVLLNGDYKVPSLLVQPYVENAIVHGLAHSEKNNLRLTVSAILKEHNIVYTIEDNGIGRKQAEAYKMQNKPYHKSVGLDISEARIKNVNRQAGTTGAVVITDLYDAEQQPAGTKVQITINAA